jgi:hypothetical protein
MPYGKRSSRERPHDAAYSSRAPSVERERPRPCRPLRPEREDGAQMAQADGDGRRAHGSENAAEHGADAGRGSHRGCVPAEDSAAPGRCAWLPEGRHSQSQPQRPAPLPAASSRLPASRRGDTGAPQEVQDLRYRLRPHRQLRTPYQVICEACTKDPSIFKVNPRHLSPGPHT